MKEDAQGPPANTQQSGDPILDVTDCTACAFSATPMDLNFFFSFLFFFGCAAWIAGSQFPKQGLNSGHGSESPESQPPGHGGTP